MKLSVWLKQANISQGSFAERIGVTQAAVTRYANGERIPQRAQMLAIVRETQGAVTAMDFYDTAPPASSAGTVAA